MCFFFSSCILTIVGISHLRMICQLCITLCAGELCDGDDNEPFYDEKISSCFGKSDNVNL